MVDVVRATGSRQVEPQQGEQFERIVERDPHEYIVEEVLKACDSCCDDPISQPELHASCLCIDL